MSKLSNWLWDWPDGKLWKLTRPYTEKSRAKRHELFLNLVKTGAQDAILDIGVTNSAFPGANYLESHYQFPENITALGNEKLVEFKKAFPKIKTVQGDGRRLPFSDNEFDIVYSNAVLEHVGDYEKQKMFIAESFRVAKRITYITTPNKFFLIDSHTLIPLAHWAPLKTRNKIYKIFGRESWASVDTLNLVSASDLKKMLAELNIKNYELKKQRFLGWTTNFMLIINK